MAMHSKQHLDNVEKINVHRCIDMKSIHLKYDMLTEDMFKDTKFTEIYMTNITRKHIDIPPTLFQHCSPYLTTLYLGGSYITEIPCGLFNGMSNLKILRLNNNNIKTFPDKLFDSCTQLTSLFLNDNPIESVSQELFHKLHNLKEVSIDFINIIIYTMLPNINYINDVVFLVKNRWVYYPRINKVILKFRRINKNSVDSNGWIFRKFAIIAKELI